ncbi:MAG: TylF/MycF family methyltransferase [Clostridiales bacterium]|nr:TylF/MycF family methyltransferase [Clostridiales bacterium]
MRFFLMLMFLETFTKMIVGLVLWKGVEEKSLIRIYQEVLQKPAFFAVILRDISIVYFPTKKIYLCDTFEGFDKRDIAVDDERKFSEGSQDWSETSIDFVLSRMPFKDNCIVRKGFFPTTMIDVDDTFCFVSLDLDLYKPIFDGLEYFYPRLVRGGYIFVHDCVNKGYLGAREAVLEFCAKHKVGYVVLPDEWGTAVLTKA